ncbi:hypothetical protein AB0D98_11465 [Streptomyces sp. NPDC047987]|uniref:hypothetical protein n=1 Tax=unclassified Streptomyces TaxID=2593676 RepID=UPI00342C3CEC
MDHRLAPARVAVPAGRDACLAVDAVTVPAAIFLQAVWDLHTRHFKRDLAEQLSLPVAALAVLACTFTGAWAALAAVLVAATTVVAGELWSRWAAPAGRVVTRQYT